MKPERSIPPIAKIRAVTLRYGSRVALDAINLDIPSGCTVGIIGSDGVGKSTLLSLIAGAREIQMGKIELLGGDMSDKHHRKMVYPRIAYMPQGLGKNLYPTLSIFENIDFFGRLFGLNKRERLQRIKELLQATGLTPFKDRPAGKLSGGMQQKLGICCALVHEPDILILDEPTTGIDPLSRRLFWEMIEEIRKARTSISILIATAYIEEASGFEWLIAMQNGQILFTGRGEEFFIQKSKTDLPLPRQKEEFSETIIEANHLTMRFGDFTAVNRVSFQIERGEIFGFVGSNGSGKTTTIKMLTGLLPPSEGEAKLFGQMLNPHRLEIRKRIGYMSQSFSLYVELTVKQNLTLHAHLYQIPEEQLSEKIEKIIHRFRLDEIQDLLPNAISQAERQRLSLAVALLPGPEILILDEPTSGVDPIARDFFWQTIMELSRKDKVTIFISTHFMNEAERCDRIALMHEGKVLVTATADHLIKESKTETLEEAFIKFLEDAGAPTKNKTRAVISTLSQSDVDMKPQSNFFSLQRMTGYVQKEALELYRDFTRLTFSLIGSIILLLAFSYGISTDVENLPFAVLDRDQSDISHDYISNIASSRYFKERSPIKNYADLDRRMRSGDISLAIEIPPNFAREIGRGKPVSIGTWIDGAMPRRAEITLGYLEGMNQSWMTNSAKRWLKIRTPQERVSIETRYLYNPDVKSQKAMVPAAFVIVLMMIPAMLSALSIAREKERGTIINLYLSPTTRLEFLIGKQIPYIVLAMISFLLMFGMTHFIFDIPLKGNFFTLLFGTLLFIATSTALGLFISTFTKSQTAAIFATGVITLLPTINFSGLLDPISSLEGIGASVGHLFPATFYLAITRGVFLKGIGFKDLIGFFIPLLITIPLLLLLSTLFLKKQEHV